MTLRGEQFRTESLQSSLKKVLSQAKVVSILNLPLQNRFKLDSMRNLDIESKLRGLAELDSLYNRRGRCGGRRQGGVLFYGMI